MNAPHPPQEATLVCELLDDCVFAESSTTDGGLTSLRYIPGASLYGASAAKLYPDMRKSGQSEDIWQLFHADQVRFGNAYPLTSAHPAWPAPCTWQVEKNQSLFDTETHLLLAELVNASAREPERGKQRKPLRAQFVSPDGHFSQPATAVQLKAAFKPGKGTASDGQLFQYQALSSGQVFAATIGCDGVVSRALFEQLLATLHGSVLRLGRSKGAQYGRVRVSVIRQSANAWPLSDAWGSSNHQQPSLTLWCVSDLCLLDEYLQPTTLAQPDVLGLPPGFQLNPAHSYIQTRRYSPYNAYRRSHDCERIVISAGSVLTFDWQQPQPPSLSVGQLRSQIGQWVGQHNGTGLGHIVVQPEWAVQPTIERSSLCAAPHVPALVPAGASQPSAEQTLESKQTQWLDWIRQRAGQAEIHNKAAHWANAHLGQVRKICLMAATLAPGGVQAVTPSASQWGRVLETCRKHPLDAQALRAALTDANGVLGGAGPSAPSQNPALRKKNQPWFYPAPLSVRCFEDGQTRSATTLGDWLLDQLHNLDKDIADCPGDALGRLASLCRRSADDSMSAHPSTRSSTAAAS